MPPGYGALSNDARLSSVCHLTFDVCLSVCLSVAYIVPKSRTERPRKTKIVAEVAHVKADNGSHFMTHDPRDPSVKNT